ncbi:hypothetical protein CLOM_g20390 [Closterium sp. NIES-68]|nr:hypothetical protein CLOM_g20390 [Closterium sp. NIES-68]GJP81681.1 hypothetical protein CLOP_g11823 [Closterium sp. NIES-67]
MFGGGFKGSKLKTQLQLSASRITVMRNKRQNELKYKRREVAMMLKGGQEARARIRVEELIREENTIAAYDVLELFCELLVARILIIESQKTCPVDLRESVSSIIFAAHRCSDLPELAEAKKLFQQKFGREFVMAAEELRPECGVNRIIVAKLSVRAPSPESKLEALQKLAEENGVEWDPASMQKDLLAKYEDMMDPQSNQPIYTSSIPAAPRTPPPHDSAPNMFGPGQPYNPGQPANVPAGSQPYESGRPSAPPRTDSLITADEYEKRWVGGGAGGQGQPNNPPHPASAAAAAAAAGAGAGTGGGGGGGGYGAGGGSAGYAGVGGNPLDYPAAAVPKYGEGKVFKKDAMDYAPSRYGGGGGGGGGGVTNQNLNNNNPSAPGNNEPSGAFSTEEIRQAENEVAREFDRVAEERERQMAAIRESSERARLAAQRAADAARMAVGGGGIGACYGSGAGGGGMMGGAGGMAVNARYGPSAYGGLSGGPSGGSVAPGGGGGGQEDGVESLDLPAPPQGIIGGGRGGGAGGGGGGGGGEGGGGFVGASAFDDFVAKSPRAGETGSGYGGIGGAGGGGAGGGGTGGVGTGYGGEAAPTHGTPAHAFDDFVARSPRGSSGSNGTGTGAGSGAFDAPSVPGSGRTHSSDSGSAFPSVPNPGSEFPSVPGSGGYSSGAGSGYGAGSGPGLATAGSGMPSGPGTAGLSGDVMSLPGIDDLAARFDRLRKRTTASDDM